jgi:hypothetical protein
MTEVKTQPLVWVKDKAGNMFFCPVDALRDPNSVTEEEKRTCVDDASRLVSKEHVPGKDKITFSESKSPS